MYGEDAWFRPGGIEGGGRPYDLTTRRKLEIDQYEDNLLSGATSRSLIHVGTSEPRIRLFHDIIHLSSELTLGLRKQTMPQSLVKNNGILLL
jgi:hypothetical protein